MRLFNARKGAQGGKDAQIGIVIISGSCCVPGMARLDEQAQQIVEQAIRETGVAAQVMMMPATTAYFGGAPREVMAQLVKMANESGQIGVPAVLVNGKAVSFGVPQLEAVKAALLQAVNGTVDMGGVAHE